MTSWLFNFSVSYQAGAMRRILATVRFFDQGNGAIFIIHSSLKNEVDIFSNKNKYFFINQTFSERLFKNERYIREVIKEYGQPDIYFSYGIPIYSKIGKLNWFHVSNALSLTVKNIRLTAKTKMKMLLLKHRIISTVGNIDIVSGESQYTLDLFQREVRPKRSISYHILRNGHNTEDISMVGEDDYDLYGAKYAMTIGISTYKRLDIVHRIFKQLQETNKDLETLYIIGSYYDGPHMAKLIPECLKLDENVVIKIINRREELVRLMDGMDYYISASQIENSSNALLEGLIYSKSVIASDISSHRELMSGKKYRYFHEQTSGEKFIHYDTVTEDCLIRSVSWDAAVKELFLIGAGLS